MDTPEHTKGMQGLCIPPRAYYSLYLGHVPCQHAQNLTSSSNGTEATLCQCQKISGSRECVVGWVENMKEGRPMEGKPMVWKICEVCEHANDEALRASPTLASLYSLTTKGIRTHIQPPTHPHTHCRSLKRPQPLSCTTQLYPIPTPSHISSLAKTLRLTSVPWLTTRTMP